jgi:predicted phage terminase large subunit-like protein
VVFGIKDGLTYVIDSYQIKLQYPELKVRVESDFIKYNPEIVLIEDKASGQSLIQDLKRNTSIPIKAIQVDGDKILRANIASMYLDKVYFSKKSSELISELLSFPFGLHDDLVDAFTQGVNYAKKLNKAINTTF